MIVGTLGGGDCAYRTAQMQSLPSQQTTVCFPPFETLPGLGTTGGEQTSEGSHLGSCQPCRKHCTLRLATCMHTSNYPSHDHNPSVHYALELGMSAERSHM